MKHLWLIGLLSIVGCNAYTEACDVEFGEGWGQGYGAEVQSSTNLDPKKCADTKDGKWWCCAM